MGPGTPTVSVALATYNGARYLGAQLESLRRQTRPPAELVVCDDGSTDDTVALLERFSAGAPFPVVLLRNDRNRGYVETFLRAAGACRGDWVAFCDQDDVWLDHKLARVVEVLGRHPEVCLLSHSADQVDADLRPLGARYPDHRAFAVHGPLRSPLFFVYPGFTCCVRRAVFEPRLVAERPFDVKYEDRRQTHDEFACNVANAYGHVATLPESLALHRRHADVVTRGADSPVHDVSARAVLKVSLGATAEGYARLGRQALEHRRFFARALRVLEGEAPAGPRHGPTADAAAYYGWLAEAFGTRAALYAAATPFPARVRAFAGNVARRAYTGTPRGRGFGVRALAKDLARVLVRW